ncbi:MAG: hypothetical protein AB7E85_00975 [Pseudobdellovibrionaceae bacterium]
MSANASKHLKFGALALMVLVLCASPALYQRGMAAWQAYQDQKATKITYDRIIVACLGEQHLSLPVSETTTKLMNCVHSHSQHGVNDAFWALRRTGDKGIAERLYSQIKQPEQTLPVMECSMRAKLLAHLLNRLGIKNHHVVITQMGEEERGDVFWDHVVVEIINPDTGRLELYDPTYNSYYEDMETDARLNIADVLSLPEERIRICLANEKTCTDERSAAAKKAFKRVWPYFGIAYRDAYREPEFLRGPLLLNPERFDIETRFKVGEKVMNFCEKKEDQCAARRILLPLDQS